MAGVVRPMAVMHAASHARNDAHTSGQDTKKRVKPYIVTEISMIRKTRTPQINYEEKKRPGMYKRRLSAEDVILGRYKYIPVSFSKVREKSVISRQKKLVSLAKKSGQRIPKFMYPHEADKENVPERVGQTPSPRPTDEDVDKLPVVQEIDEDNEEGISREEDEEGDVFLEDKFGEKDDGEDSDDDLSDNEEETDGFGEYVSYLVEKKRDKKLTSDDFDTDFGSEDTEEEEEPDVLGREKPVIKVNETLLNYERACSRLEMRVNPTFVRQCGRSSVDMQYRMLTYKDARPIAISLASDHRISFLDLSNNPLGPIGVSAISEVLLVNTTIMELNLSSTYPETKGMEALAKSLSENNTLRRLYLENNNLQVGDGFIIASLIENATSLLELHLVNNSLGFDGTKRIAKALSLNKGKLNVLNLSYNNIRMDSAVQLAAALKKNTILRSLDVSWNGFGVDGCRALATALLVNTTLRDLNLTCNRLGIKSLGYLMKGLIKNKGLHCIRVALNPLTTEGAKSLVSAITTSKESALTELDLKGIPLDEEFFTLKDKLCQTKVIRVHYDDNIHLGTYDITKESDGTFLDNFSPVLVMFEFMKKDNLRVIDYFQFFDTRRRDKLSKSDLATGFNILLIPFTQHHVDIIMKTLDTNKDGFISLDEMVNGYTKTDKMVKKRRIRANMMKKKDQGLENLWLYLKSLIVKRKEENVKKNAAISKARRDSLLPITGRKGSLLPGGEGRRGSIMPGADSRRGSVLPGGAETPRAQSGSEGRKGSLLPESDSKRGSISESSSGSSSRQGSGPLVNEARRGSILLRVPGIDQGGLSNTRPRGLFPGAPNDQGEEPRRSSLLAQKNRSDIIEEEAHTE